MTEPIVPASQDVEEINSPKVFVSYSHTSPHYKDKIRTYAEQLRAQGVDIILDQWHLAKGQDVYEFMEQMVTDSEVSNVLVFCDAAYVQKADSRIGGAGAESQIMSPEVYKKARQKKVIPIVCELQDNGEPFLPAFLKSRFYIDFSSPELVNKYWDDLLRAIYDRPLHPMPELGKPPSYLFHNQDPALPTHSRYNALRNALIEDKSAVHIYRDDFLDSVFGFFQSLKDHEYQGNPLPGEKVFCLLRILLPLRDQLAEWLLLESKTNKSGSMVDWLGLFLERLLSTFVGIDPSTLTPNLHACYESQRFFTYEVFLYVVSALIGSRRFEDLSLVFNNKYIHYVEDNPAQSTDYDFHVFRCFSQILRTHFRNVERKLVCPEALLIRERSTFSEFKIGHLMEAEAVIFVASMVMQNGDWYPYTLLGAGYGFKFPIFLRAAQHHYFKNLSVIFGVGNGEELRAKFGARVQKSTAYKSSEFSMAHVDFHNLTNMDKLDTE